MPAPRCIGIDGCPAGWVAASTDGITVAKDLATLLDTLAVIPERDVVAIDMPIGLMDEGTRACDRAARAALGNARRNSVFWTATRDAVWAETEGLSLREAHARASEINRQRGAGGVSAQAYNLFPKIREVETLLLARPELQATIHEVHPELSFAHWRAQQSGIADDTLAPMPHAKKSALGAHDRLTLVIERHGRDALEAARAAHSRSELADDDMIDAYGACHSARRIQAGTAATLPEPPPIDRGGLPIRIRY